MGETVTALVSLDWVKIAALIVLVEKALTIISELTPWKWDDNLAKIVTKLVKGIIQPLIPKKK